MIKLLKAIQNIVHPFLATKILHTISLWKKRPRVTGTTTKNANYLLKEHLRD
jgi:hypothetical protein